MQFNSDAGSNYIAHYIKGDSYAVTASSVSLSPIRIQNAGMSSFGNTTIYGASITDIIDYASTSKYKTTKTFAGADANVTDVGNKPQISLNSGLWTSTSAITTITLQSNGTAFASGTTFTLYGVS